MEASTSTDHPKAEPGLLVITEHSVIEEPVATQLFDLHVLCFEELHDHAALRNVYTREFWDDDMSSELVHKIVAWVDGEPIGLCTGIIEPDRVGYVSGDFLRNQAEGRKIFYQALTVVHPDHRNLRVVRSLFETGIAVAHRENALVAFDTNRWNIDNGYVELIRRVLRRQGISTLREIDSHHWYVFDAAATPEPS